MIDCSISLFSATTQTNLLNVHPINGSPLYMVSVPLLMVQQIQSLSDEVKVLKEELKRRDQEKINLYNHHMNAGLQLILSKAKSLLHHHQMIPTKKMAFYFNSVD